MKKFGIDTSIHDPWKLPQIWNYHINQQDEIHRACIGFGPYQFSKDLYPFFDQESNPHRFQAYWFKHFSWLEDSPNVDVAFCLLYYLISKKSSPFTLGGVRNLKKKGE